MTLTLGCQPLILMAANRTGTGGGGEPRPRRAAVLAPGLRAVAPLTAWVHYMHLLASDRKQADSAPLVPEELPGPSLHTLAPCASGALRLSVSEESSCSSGRDPAPPAAPPA